MNITNYKKNILASAVAIALMPIAISTSFSALAAQENEESAKAKKQNKEIEVIEVVGMRSEVANAQEIKRLASTVKDVITAEDIGSLPDKSVTEALQRVPGVTIERFQSTTDSNHFSSEGTGVVVRGLKRVRSEINGRDAFSSSANGGGLSYADIPGQLLKRIEVVKNTTADLVSGGVAGTVNLVTRKAFDSEGMKVYGQIKGSYGDDREELTPAASFLFSNVWDSDKGKFGFLVSGTNSQYKDQGDGVGVNGFYERSTTAHESDYFGDNGTAIPGMEDQTLYTPAGIAIRTSDSERERNGVITSVQWESPNRTFEITAEYIYSNATRNWEERVVQYAQQGFAVNPNQIGFVSGEFNSDGFMTSGELTVDMLAASSRFNQVETNIEDMSLHLNYLPSENLTLSFDFQHVKSDNTVNDSSYTSLHAPTMASWYSKDGITRPSPSINVTGAQFDLTTEVPSGINFTGDLTNPEYPEQAYVRNQMEHAEDNEGEADSIAIDLEYMFDEGWITAVKTGVYASKKSQLSRSSNWNWVALASAWSAIPFETSYLSNPDLYETYTFEADEFFGGGILNGDQSFLFPRMDLVKEYDTFGKNLVDRDGATDGFLPTEITDTDEKRLEVYVQFDYEYDDANLPIKGNFGLRYVSWQVESTGGLSYPSSFGWDPRGGSAGDLKVQFPEEAAFSNGATGPINTVEGEKYTRILPSFNLSMEMSEDHILRFAVSENIYLPVFKNFQNYRNIYGSRIYEYDEALGGSVVTDVTFAGLTGNPDIKPEEALNIDLSLEWYFSDAGSLNINLFRKDLDNLIRTRLYTEDVYNPEADTTMPVAFQTDTNEGSGTISGFELSYTQFYDFLPGAWGGLGLSANYTFIAQSDVNDSIGFGEGSPGQGGRNDFRTFSNLDLPGYSDDTANLALMYQKYGISARLAYSWRSDYLLTRRDADQFAPVIALATGQLDGSLSYRINKNFSAGLQVSNILDEVIKTESMFEENGRQTPRSHFNTDRRMSVFVTATF